jgi:hypothetical protein
MNKARPMVEGAVIIKKISQTILNNKTRSEDSARKKTNKLFGQFVAAMYRARTIKKTSYEAPLLKDQAPNSPDVDRDVDRNVMVSLKNAFGESASRIEEKKFAVNKNDPFQSPLQNTSQSFEGTEYDNKCPDVFNAGPVRERQERN